MSSDEQTALTPMMRQYRRVKSEIDDDVILMFRLGDFYEMFFEDAQKASPILGVVLTKRNGYPMCGVPYHAIDSYLAKLVRANMKVAICEQMEDPASAKGIVRREVTRVVTPGTVTEGDVISDDCNSFIASVSKPGKLYGLALMDLSTGEFVIQELETASALRDALSRSAPRECLLAESDMSGELASIASESRVNCLTDAEDWRFGFDIAHETLVRHFGVTSLDGFGCEGRAAAIGAAGALLHYVGESLRRSVEHVRGLRLARQSGVMLIDDATYAHLDLLPPQGAPAGGTAATTLFGVLNSTCSPMGARLLRAWIQQPLCDVAAISARHDAVASFILHRDALSVVRRELSLVRDLERLIAKISSGRCCARDINATAEALSHVEPLRSVVAPLASAWMEAAVRNLTPLPELVESIRATLVDDPPAQTTDGGMIREGVSAELDELRLMANDGRAWIGRYQAEQTAKTGIRNLKVRHTGTFGYFIEVPSSQLSNVPPEYQRRQTTVNSERFITPELKEYEEKIFGAHDKSVGLEISIFTELREKVVKQTSVIQRIASAMAALDVVSSLADRALALGYIRPEMRDDDLLEIIDGRHPVVEQLPDAERFVPNDTRLDCGENQIIVITGPNMAGKSTYIRQVAVIAVMAQMGSFVPAKSARIGCIDRVFTRVGASDDLARGRSTFMVEMQETANILNNATPKSLVVLDEIGRGTSTFDGISIAWAVAEHLHNTPSVKARTLFATHYHELTDLEMTLPGVKNYCVLVREQKGGIAFLRRIVRGAADKSYGIAVAQLAGMPSPVITRAREILSNLEEGEINESGSPKLAKSSSQKRRQSDTAQMTLFDL